MRCIRKRVSNFFVHIFCAKVLKKCFFSPPPPFVGGIIVSSLDGTTGNGTSNNTFSYTDEAGNTFNSVDDAAFNVITVYQESGTLAPTQAPDAKVAQESIAPSFLDNGFGSVRLMKARTSLISFKL